MKVIGNFNKISAELKKQIKPLKRGEQAHYRLLTGSYDMVSGFNRYGASTTIVCSDTIRDGENLVDIGVPREIKEGEVVRCKKFYVSPSGDNILHNGVFSLYGDNLEHLEFYDFFELSNKNKSNPNRDASVQPLFERIDEEKEAEVLSNEIDALTKALTLASQMSKTDIIEFAQVKNWNTKEPLKVLVSRVKTYAKDEPEQFLAIVDDPQNKTKITIKQALDAGVIQYQPAEHKMLWGKDGSAIARLDRAEEGEDPALDCFYRWLREKSNGENILKSIQTQLKNLAKSE